MLLLIDNYDSFVHNLARYVRELGVPTEVYRNDRLTVTEIAALKPQAIIISPGPCTPNEAGVSLEVIQQLQGTIPILGVCLGHQAIAQALGGRVIRAPEPVHGRSSWVRHRGTPLFAGVSNPFVAGRYHSLMAEVGSLPARLEITAVTDDQLPMAIEDSAAKLFGLQFHPESVLTQFGHRLLANFLRLAGLEPLAIPGSDLQPQPLACSGERAPVIAPVAWPAPLTEAT
jgi:anthranilate synthase/aminodeoxychorismate synthase-like glutamine amidotransferase